MLVQPWLSSSELASACQHKSLDDQDTIEVWGVVKDLEASEIEPELWTTRKFQSEV